MSPARQLSANLKLHPLPFYLAWPQRASSTADATYSNFCASLCFLSAVKADGLIDNVNSSLRTALGPPVSLMLPVSLK